MTDANILVEQRGAALWLTLDREHRLNALSTATLHELRQAITTAEQSEHVRTVVIIGSGDRAFSAGADLREVRGTAPHAFLGANMLGHRVFSALRSSPLPVIAAINGLALGGGLELALACDVRIAVDSARLGLPEVSVGVLPGWGGTWRLAEAVGPAKAREMILTGAQLRAGEAERAGLVSSVVGSRAELAQAAAAVADRVAAQSGPAVAAAKALLNAQEDPTGVQAVAESGSVASMLRSDHFLAATASFADERKDA